MVGPVVCVSKLADTFIVKTNATLFTDDDPLVRSCVGNQREELDGNVFFGFSQHQNVCNRLR